MVEWYVPGVQLSTSVVRDPDGCETRGQGSFRILWSTDSLDKPSETIKNPLETIKNPSETIKTHQKLFKKTSETTKNGRSKQICINGMSQCTLHICSTVSLTHTN